MSAEIKIRGYQADCGCGWSSPVCETAMEAGELARTHYLEAHPVESMEFYSHGPQRSETQTEEA